MSEETTETVEVLVEPDPLQATQAELVAAKAKAAATQTPQQFKNSLSASKDWVDLATDLGLAIYERQPEESNLEWQIWTTYRAHYPGRMPTWTELAKECNCSTATVTKAANKWRFRMRLVSWSNYTDAGMAQERIEAIQEMNRQQLEQARMLRAKVTEALDYLDPATLKPNELATLMKLANEQERRIVEAVPEKVEGQAAITSDAAAESRRTDAANVNEILSIMAAAGALGKNILGVEKQTVTTERVVLKGTEEET